MNKDVQRRMDREGIARVGVGGTKKYQVHQSVTEGDCLEREI